jgi:hypothetical protein
LPLTGTSFNAAVPKPSISYTLNLLSIVISDYNPLIKSATEKEISYPFDKTKITVLVLLSYLPETTIVSRGKSIV